MNEPSLLSSLQNHFPVFGPAVIQRLAGVGYTRALEMLEDLHARGLIRPAAEPFRWELNPPRP